MVNPSVSGLSFAKPSPSGQERTNRNLNLNDGYKPAWDQTLGIAGTNQGGVASQLGNAKFDPFQQTQWSRFLDTLAEEPPHGVKIPPQRGNPLGGLKLAGETAGFQKKTPSVSNPFATPQRLQGY